MKFIKFSILASIIWSLPSFLLAYFSPSLGSAISHLTFLLLILYYVISKPKGPVLIIFLVLGLLYYFIGAINYSGGLTAQEYFTMILKYVIIIICGAEVLRKTSLKELYIFLLIGSLSIIINTIFFPLHNANFNPTYGRFSGFYLNPNYGGAISLLGISLTFGIKDVRWKYLGYLIFTVAGFFTFSRYFLGMWLIMNFISVFISRKNLIIPLIGALGLFVIFAFSSSLKLNADRFNAIQSIFSENSNTAALEEDSRTDTWATYTDVIMNNPFVGNGYDKLKGNNFGLREGVHNTYLLVIGEGGILPFLILLGIYAFLLFKGYLYFKTEPYYFMLALALATALLVSHNYFDRFSFLLVTIYLYVIFTEKSDMLNDENSLNNSNI